MNETDKIQAPVLHDWSFPGLHRRVEAEYGVTVAKVPGTKVSPPEPVVSEK